MIDFKKQTKEFKLNPNPKPTRLKKPRYYKKMMRKVRREMPF